MEAIDGYQSFLNTEEIDTDNIFVNNGIRFGNSNDTLKTYNRTILNGNWSGPVASTQRDIILERTGNKVEAHFDALLVGGNSTASPLNYSVDIPSKFLPKTSSDSNENSWMVEVVDAGSSVQGLVSIDGSTGNITVVTDFNSNFTATDLTVGFYNININYLVQ